MTTKWGILSTAGINEQILAAAAKSELMEVVAVASRDDDRARSYAQAHGITRSYGSYAALLADPEVEAVYISLPNAVHAEWSVRALEAGKHVLCEKPFSRHAADVTKAFDAASRHGRLLMEGLMYRHHPQTAKTAALVASGAIGRVQFVRAALSFELKGPNIRLSRDLEGGAMMDLGCYCISSLRLIAGEPQTVLGTEITTADGVDTRFFATMMFANEVVGQFDVAMTMPYRGQLEIVGSEGILVVGDPWICAHPGIEIRRGDKIEQIAVELVDHYQLELENMCRAIAGQESPRLGRDDAMGQARAIEALYAAAAAGRRISLGASL